MRQEMQASLKQKQASMIMILIISVYNFIKRQEQTTQNDEVLLLKRQKLRKPMS